MANPSTKTHQKFCKSLSLFAAVFAIVMGALVLWGWQIDITFLKSVIPGYMSMNPATAVCFLLLGVSLFIHHFSYNPLRYSIATVCAGLVLLVAVSRLGNILFGFSFPVDRWLFKAQLGDNHMAITTAFIFLFLGGAQLTLRSPKQLIRQILITLAIMLSIIALVAYVYQVGALYQMPGVIEIALNAAITFLIFSCGLLCFEPDYGFMGILTDEGISGVMSRQLLPWTLIALIVVGWLRLLGQQLGLYDLQMGILVHLFLMMGVSIALIWVCGLILAGVDKERHEKEEKVLQLSRAVENSPVSIVITDNNGNIEYVNPKFVDVTGYSFLEVIGETPRILKSGEQSREFYKNLWGTIKKGDEWHGEFHNKKKNGELYWESASISSLKDPHGNITHFLAVKEDITLRKAQEELIHKKTQELEVSNQELEHFAFVASHDLQEPIRKMVGFSQLLGESFKGKLEDEPQGYLNSIVNGAKRMSALISDLLEYSRARQIDLNFEETDFNAMMNEALSILETSIEENQAVIKYSDLPMLKVHRNFIVSVFANLIANAIKYREPEVPRINISARRVDDLWEFTVSDNGIGIEPQYIPKLFVIFQRLHGKFDYEGTGIGLAYCKRMIERHGGKIWIEPHSGQGAIFKFTLPIR